MGSSEIKTCTLIKPAGDFSAFERPLERAFKKRLLRYVPMLFRVALKLEQDAEAAERLTMDTLTDVYEHWTEYFLHPSLKWALLAQLRTRYMKKHGMSLC